MRPDSRFFATVDMLVLCSLLAAVAPAAADGMVRRATIKPGGAGNIELDFKALAQQGPWRCRVEPADSVPATGWSGGSSQCAWKNRLRLREWSGAGGAGPTGCISAQAAWWAWARAGGPGTPPQPMTWRTGWSARSLIADQGAEQRAVIVRRMPDGSWRASEWRWSPSPRLATRRWQQGRWDLLVARARTFQQGGDAPAPTPQARMLWQALELQIGARSGEIGAHQVNWLSEGLCLRVDAAAPGPQQLQLPYSPDDSRLEQRAAMQLQLARRFAKASWLTPFTLAAAPAHTAHAKRGGAKFYAIWTEGRTLSGQLWIPTKGEGPLVRVRISTALPAAASGPAAESAQLAATRAVIERELLGVAASWTFLNE